MRGVCFFSLLALALFAQSERAFVTAHLMGQLGNNLFQVAAASALAWDHDAEVYFPDIWPPSHMQHVFFRCAIKPIRPEVGWKEPSFLYHPIPYAPNIQL